MNLFPSRPQNVPENLIEVSGAYKWRVLVVLLSIFLFLTLYLALVGGAGYLVYLALVRPLIGSGLIAVLLKLGMIAMASMLFVFLIKFAFKFGGSSTEGYLELRPDEYPELFDFLKRLCDETRSPMPKKVFASEDINAAVFYNSNFWSLFLPTRKNLLIGLGVVNSVNLAQFKAVLAHEFGHFSQSSMRLGGYVYMANAVIYGMVYERDKWDNALEEWSGMDFRIAIFAWLVLGVVWCLRQVLNGMFQLINIFHASLSRQMEFHADLVAVSVTGSDAIIDALAKLGPAEIALGETVRRVSDAADHGMFTHDIFAHHRLLLDANIDTRNPAEGDRVFSKQQDSVPDIYAGHPPNHEREENAKRTHIPESAEITMAARESPWLLFSGGEEKLREHFSRFIYREYLGNENIGDPTSPGELEEFFTRELAETKQSERYQGLYEDRYIARINNKNIEEILSAHPMEAGTAKTAAREIYEREIPARADELKGKKGKVESIIPMLLGETHAKPVDVSGRRFAANDLEKALESASDELGKTHESLQEFDKKVFAVHHALAVDKKDKKELIARYVFHSKIQAQLSRMNETNETIEQVLNYINENGSPTEDQIEEVFNLLEKARRETARVLEATLNLKMPALVHLEEKGMVSDFLLDEPFLTTPMDGENDDINQLARQSALIQKRLRRLDSKSLGALLSFQEELAAIGSKG